VKRFAKSLDLAVVAVFGGSGVANQISELKRGAEIVAASPGRLIDLLVTGAGKIINLRRVTFLVIDEADRMFDMGFEPQIMRVVNNIRPDRQTVMFSATFPRSVETLARQALKDPVEIQVRPQQGVGRRERGRWPPVCEVERPQGKEEHV
jgi:ATP-dependent RNA helicase DDX46/PRP5